MIEYKYLCNQLSSIDSDFSLSNRLKKISLIEGLRTQAALDYYENLRTARIVNHTRHDKNTLNMDIDHFANDFETMVKSLLDHLNLELNSAMHEYLVESMNWYDLKKSWTHRSLMKAAKHIYRDKHDELDKMMKIIKEDEFINALYQPIFEFYS